MDVRSLSRAIRDGQRLAAEDIEAFIAGCSDGTIDDARASAVLGVVFARGLADEDLVVWTRAMLDSGSRLDFTGLDRPVVDKHSTGGVGDKISLPLAPAAAACGLAVPMISGRGLGHTGGTLDKLEAIPGFSTDLQRAEFERLVREHGFALGGQTADLAPADRRLYALRDHTGLIASRPLIASSILSKKLAEGISVLVLDVKFGSGAFLPEPADGAALARTMIDVAGRMDVSVTAFQTAMDRPLGRAAGHTLEVIESLECLRGGGPPDVRELVEVLGGEMLTLAGIAADEAQGRARIARALDDGSALEAFVRLAAAQGGDTSVLEAPERWERTDTVEVFAADRSGFLRFADVAAVGRAVLALGGGREHPKDTIDPAVGVVWTRRVGEEVQAGEPLAEIHHRAGRGVERARASLSRAIEIGAPGEVSPLVLARIGD